MPARSCPPILVAIALLTAFLPGTRAAAPPEIPVSGYRLVWADEFNGTQLDTNKWGFRQLGPRREAVNVRDTVALDGQGHLILTTRMVTNAIHTAMISTDGKFAAKYGYFECRVKLQRTHGNWSAFWLQSPKLGTVLNDTRRSGAEIDIYECFTVRWNAIVHNLHWNGYRQHHRHVGSGKVEVPGLSRGFHTFGVEWTPEAYQFFVNGRPTWRTTEAVSGIEQFIILSLEVGAKEAKVARATPGFVDETCFDYVRVYQKNP
jgi:beta-glucanase (GH16 family)